MNWLMRLLMILTMLQTMTQMLRKKMPFLITFQIINKKILVELHNKDTKIRYILSMDTSL